jgi:hypothetical protein
MSIRDQIQMCVSDDDMQLLLYLRARMPASEMRFNRNQRIVTFQKQLKLIENYSIRGNDDDWKRCHGCGVCWLDIQTVAVNVSRLSWLLGKAKSLINTNFNLKGYEIGEGSPEVWNLLRAKLPVLKRDVSEMRRWTIRKLIQREDRELVDNEEKELV